MCFSATASFATAAVAGMVGVAAASRAHAPREWPFALTPVFFAVQQAIEGVLWLTLPAAPAGQSSGALTVAFVLFAEVFWPVYAPAAVLLLEPDRARRRVMAVCLALGAAVAAWLLWDMIQRPKGAEIVGGHIVYATLERHTDLIGFGYLAATGVPLLLSSHRTVVAVGAIVLAGSAVAYVLYWEAFVSVWCFFAAAASVTILAHFVQMRRREAEGATGSLMG